MYFQVYLKLCL